MPRWFAGELIGTFLLVFFGCGSVATVVAHEASVGLFQVAIVWGLGLSAAMVYALFGGAITRFEQANGITRGLPGSEASAMIFGEYFPNPGARPLTEEARQTVPHWRAALAEFFGTALLAPPFWHWRFSASRPAKTTPVRAR